jgi:hypothetical protein
MSAISAEVTFSIVLVSFLDSEPCGFVSGQVIYIDGGLSVGAMRGIARRDGVEGGAATSAHAQPYAITSRTRTYPTNTSSRRNRLEGRDSCRPRCRSHNVADPGSSLRIHYPQHR